MEHQADHSELTFHLITYNHECSIILS